MITEAEVNAVASSLVNGHLTDIHQRLTLALFRQSPSYDAYTYPDVIDRLARLSGLGAQILLAALRKVEKLGASTTKLTGGRDAIDFDIERDREALVMYMLWQLYDRTPNFGITHISEVGEGYTTTEGGFAFGGFSSGKGYPWQ